MAKQRIIACMIETYRALKTTYQNQVEHLSKQYNRHSLLRFMVAIPFLLVLLYHASFPSFIYYLILFVLALIFLLLVRSHQRVSVKRACTQLLEEINGNEIQFLSNHALPFYNGVEFTDHTHPYSYDLDFFGDHSIYQYLNRTVTFKGREMLATDLLSIRNPNDITAHQEAIAELSKKIDWRQQLMAFAQVKSDSKESVEKLKEWSQLRVGRFSFFLNLLSIALPLATLGAIVTYIVTDAGLWFNISALFILSNLILLASKAVSIKKEILPSSEIDLILRQYGLLIKHIEQEAFTSPLINEIKERFIYAHHTASQEITYLSKLFTRMDHVQNVFASPLLNGLFLYHIHALRSLFRWRLKHGEHIAAWLEAIGKMESLSSFANFSYNNPSYVFPTLNTNHEISFSDLGHPLIAPNKRVVNDVTFNDHRFVILTGSNMSGKSTFLRTLGINMVLAGTGAPVCASAASIHPLPVIVSMRLTDSLTDSQSYFLAEVQRLKDIMDTQKQSNCYILLDEILRGTNSDDKRTGTIEVVRKMVELGAIGMIATHDLEVCKTAEESPEVLTNKRFEVAIEEDELVFDYKLRDGVCENKSATFLMKKLGVI